MCWCTSDTALSGNFNYAEVTYQVYPFASRTPGTPTRRLVVPGSKGSTECPSLHQGIQPQCRTCPYPRGSYQGYWRSPPGPGRYRAWPETPDCPRGTGSGSRGLSPGRRRERPATRRRSRVPRGGSWGLGWAGTPCSPPLDYAKGFQQIPETDTSLVLRLRILLETFFKILENNKQQLQ